MTNSLARQTRQSIRHKSSRGADGRTRRQSGTIADSAAGLVVLVGLVVAGLLLLVNVAMVSYYKDKIGLVTNQAAGYAASICSWNYSHDASITDEILSQRTASVVTLALGHMKLPTGRDVVVRAQRGADDTVMVTVTVNNLKLAGEGNIMPLTITLTDSSVATLNNDKPPMLVRIGTTGYVPAAIGIVPAYGQCNPSNPNNILAGLGPHIRETQLGWHISYGSSFGANPPDRKWLWGDGWVQE